MSATSILNARKIIRSISKKDMEELANKAISCQTEEEVKELVDSVLNH